jgi:hypothetical protein
MIENIDESGVSAKIVSDIRDSSVKSHNHGRYSILWSILTIFALFSIGYVVLIFQGKTDQAALIENHTAKIVMPLLTAVLGYYFGRSKEP